MPPIGGKLFDKNNKESVNLHKKYLDQIAYHLSKDVQYQYLANNWISYDISLSTKAPTPFTNKYNKDGYTPLHRAVLERDLALVKELIQVPGIDVNMYTSDAHRGHYASKYMSQETPFCMAKDK